MTVFPFFSIPPDSTDSCSIAFFFFLTSTWYHVNNKVKFDGALPWVTSTSHYIHVLLITRFMLSADSPWDLHPIWFRPLLGLQSGVLSFAAPWFQFSFPPIQHGCQIAIWSIHDHGCAEDVLKSTAMLYASPVERPSLVLVMVINT